MAYPKMQFTTSYKINKVLSGLATQNRLNRYDGYNFKTYTHDPLDSLSIAGNELLKLFEDSRGRIWIGTYSKGVSCFDPKTDRFYQFRVGEEGVQVQPFVFMIGEDSDGTIWIGGRQAALLSVQTGVHDFDFKVQRHKVSITVSNK